MDSSFKSGGIRVVSGLSLPSATSSSVQAPLSSSRASVFGTASGGTSARGTAVSTSASMVLSNMEGSMFSKPPARAGSARSTAIGGQSGPSSGGKPGQASSLPFSDVDDILSSLSTEDQEGLGWARVPSRRALDVGATDSERAARARRDADARAPAQYSSNTHVKPAEVEFWVPSPEKTVLAALSAVQTVPLPASPAAPAPSHSRKCFVNYYVRLNFNV